MSTRDIVIDSANAAIHTVGTDEFAKLTKYALNLTGSEVGRHLNATDRPGLFSAVAVEQDGKDRLGAILALEDRAIIAWTVGTLRMKNFETVIPCSSIENVELTTRPGGAMSKDREVLRIEAAQTWTLVFANVFEGGRSIAPFLKGVLEGSTRPVFDDGRSREQTTPQAIGAPSSLAGPSGTAEPKQRIACPSCGAAARPDARFCRSCGDRFSADAPVTLVARPPGVSGMTREPRIAPPLSEAPAPASATRRGWMIGIGAALLVLIGGSAAFALTRSGQEPDRARTAGESADSRPRANARDGELEETEPELGPEESEPTDSGEASQPEVTELSERLTGAGYVADVPSRADGWELGEERPSNGGQLRIRVLRGPDDTMIRLVHSPGTEARPDSALVVDEQPLRTAAAESRLVTLDNFPTDECQNRLCSDFVLNDPAYGGIALLVNAVEGDAAFAVADAIARTVRSAAQSGEDPEQSPSRPDRTKGLPPETFSVPGQHTSRRR